MSFQGFVAVAHFPEKEGLIFALPPGMIPSSKWNSSRSHVEALVPVVLDGIHEALFEAFFEAPKQGEKNNEEDLSSETTKRHILGGGFHFFLFSPLLGEMIQFD